jgi:hypothetical protein
MNDCTLTAPERETVLLSSDADKTWSISTHQRKVLTKLKNAGWTPAEDLTFGSQPGARFEVPFEAITIRSRSSVETHRPGNFAALNGARAPSLSNRQAPSLSPQERAKVDSRSVLVITETQQHLYLRSARAR